MTMSATSCPLNVQCLSNIEQIQWSTLASGEVLDDDDDDDDKINY